MHVIGKLYVISLLSWHFSLIQCQLKWPNFPGVHSLLLKGCTNPATYESTIRILSHMTLLLDFAVVDPSQSLAFPMNVIALLPYMVQVIKINNELSRNLIII